VTSTRDNQSHGIPRRLMRKASRRALLRRRRRRLSTTYEVPRADFAIFTQSEAKLLDALAKLNSRASIITLQTAIELIQGATGPTDAAEWLAAAKRDLGECIDDASRTELQSNMKSVLEATGKHVEALLERAPTNIEQPEIGVGREGEISLYWWGAAGFSMTLEIWPSGKLVYAAIFGHRNTYGIEYVNGHFPVSIGLALQRISQSKRSETVRA
jgi:hypothetical protein